MYVYVYVCRASLVRMRHAYFTWQHHIGRDNIARFLWTSDLAFPTPSEPDPPFTPAQYWWLREFLSAGPAGPSSDSQEDQPASQDLQPPTASSQDSHPPTASATAQTGESGVGVLRWPRGTCGFIAPGCLRARIRLIASMGQC